MGQKASKQRKNKRLRTVGGEHERVTPSPVSTPATPSPALTSVRHSGLSNNLPRLEGLKTSNEVAATTINNHTTPSSSLSQKSETSLGRRSRESRSPRIDEEDALQDLDDILDRHIDKSSRSRRSASPEWTKEKRVPPQGKPVSRSSSNIEHTRYSQILFAKRGRLADEEEIGLGAIPERDYPKTQNTMGYGLPRAVSMSHLTQPQNYIHGGQNRLWTQVAWKKPFARELEEKIQIGIDHDFIGHHNRRSGYYASNEQVNQNFRRYDSEKEIHDIYHYRSPSYRNSQFDYFGDEPTRRHEHRAPVMNKVHRTYYSAHPKSHQSDQNVQGTRYSKISGTDFTVIPRAKPSHRQFNSRPKSSYAIF